MIKQCIENKVTCCLQVTLSDGHLQFLNLTEPICVCSNVYDGHRLSKGHALLKRQHDASTSPAISTATCDRQRV